MENVVNRILIGKYYRTGFVFLQFSREGKYLYAW
jgi:hypothetical protein